MKRFIPIILSLTLFLSYIPTSHAASDEATQAAQELYELGLFSGTGSNPDGTPNFDLDRAPTRQEAITMLVRLLGKEEDAKAGTWDIPFTDVDNWAKPYVGYAYVNGLTTGTGESTFGSNDAVTASQYLTFVLRALGYESGTDFQWDKAEKKAEEVISGYWYNETEVNFTRGDIAKISQKALKSYKKGTANLLCENLNNTNFGYSGVGQNELQGIWFYNPWENKPGIRGRELIFDGSIATYMMSNGLETVFETGPYTITESGKVQWISSDYYLYAPTAFGESVVHRNNEQKVVLSSPTLTANGLLNNEYMQVEKSALYEYCHGIVDKYNSGLSTDEKSIVTEKMKNVIGNQVIVTENMMAALSYGAQLTIDSIGGMNYSKRLDAQNGMQKAELAVITSCFLIKEDIADVRAIFEKKTGTESLTKTLSTLERTYNEICNMTANTDYDQLMDMNDLTLAAGEALSEIADIIMDIYLK